LVKQISLKKTNEKQSPKLSSSSQILYNNNLNLNSLALASEVVYNYQSILIISKLSDRGKKYSEEVVNYLVAKDYINNIYIRKGSGYDNLLEENKEKVKAFSNGNSIDLAIVIGGDGTVLDTKKFAFKL